MAKFRPDLHKRILNLLDASPVKRLSVKDVAKVLGESVQDVAACFKNLVEFGFLNPVKPNAMKRCWTGSRHKVRDVLDLYEIVRFDRPEEPVEKNSKKCPKCGRPVKRRHARSEVHNSHKCEMDNIRDIMGE